MKTMTPADIAAEAITLYREYVERHGYDEDDAEVAAVLGVAEGCAVTEDELRYWPVPDGERRERGGTGRTVLVGRLG